MLLICFKYGKVLVEWWEVLDIMDELIWSVGLYDDLLFC